MKKSIVFLLVMLSMLLVFSVPVGAATEEENTTPAQAVASLTGRTTESVFKERRETGKSLGKIAEEAGVLDEFNQACDAIMEKRLGEMVAQGRISREEADSALQAMRERRELCVEEGNKSGMGCGGALDGEGWGNRGNGNGAGRGAGGCGRFTAGK